MTNDLANSKATKAPTWSDADAVNDLFDRAKTGDQSTARPLRALFAAADCDPSILTAYGSPPRWLQNDLVKLAAGKDIAVEQACEQTLATLRRDLEGPNPSAMERLLAERAAICWFLVNRYESYAASLKDASIRQAEHQQRKIDKAHARFLSALKTLATIRKLATPVLQVNIGTNQINTVSAEPIS